MATIKFPTENKLKKTKKEEIIKFLKEEVEPAYTDLAVNAILDKVTDDSYTELEDEFAVLKAENQALKKEVDRLTVENKSLTISMRNTSLDLQAYRDKANVLEFNVITLEGSNFWTKLKVLFSRNGVIDYFNGETCVQVSKC